MKQLLFSGKRKLLTIPFALGLGLVFLPFVIGGSLAWVVYKRVSNKKIQYTALGIIGFFTLFIGSAWVIAVASPSETQPAKLIEPTRAIVTAVLTPTPTQPQPTPTESQSVKQEATVVKVIDGDTITVILDGKKETIRIIGIDTPEIVDPRKTVQCFGQEASRYAKLYFDETDKRVWLEADQTQGDRDKYQRLLRYVFTNDGVVDFGKVMIQLGYGSEYTYSTPYKYQSLYKQAEKEARESKKGLWADDACVTTSTITSNTTQAQPVQQQAPQQNITTNTGSCKYACSGADKDCSDFSSHSEAQAFFQCCGFTADNDPMKLDSVGVGDGIACESI